jgi:hypothetical protein
MEEAIAEGRAPKVETTFLDVRAPIAPKVPEKAAAAIVIFLSNFGVKHVARVGRIAVHIDAEIKDTLTPRSPPIPKQYEE